jgi:carbonic anhydrase/acetyltransferase-like protein (isoleucine patch superfamily)
VSSGAIVLHRARVCTGAIVGANSVVLNDTVVPAKALAVGSPAVIKEGRARAEDIAYGAENYVQRTARFKRELRRID